MSTSTLLKADAGTATVYGFDVAAKPGEVRESISLTASRSSAGARSSRTEPSPSSSDSSRPAQVEYVEKQPSLEDVFLTLVGEERKEPR